MTRISWFVPVFLGLSLVAGGPRATGQTVADVVSFTGANNLADPGMTPVQGRVGKLYGTITGMFNATSGSVFDFTAAGSTKVLYSLTGSAGVYPTGVILGSDGNFYGVASSGGSLNGGVLFKVTPSGTYAVLHNFTGETDGLEPEATPIEGSDGNFYGTTNGGCCHSSTIYKYTRAGAFTTIYTYDNTHGINAGDLMQGSDGNLYVAASSGGTNNNGTIVQLSTAGKLLSYYAFPGGPGGSFPLGLVQASNGNYYGVTFQGGQKENSAGIGTIFRYTPPANVTVLYIYNPLSTNGGGYPSGIPIQATDGYLYGVTLAGGTYGNGTVYRISTTGKYQQLYSFPTTVGREPTANLLQATSGLFYGSAQSGGPNGYGAIFSLNMGLGPFITFVQATGKIGKAAQILGQGFTGTTSITFNGLPASSFTVVNDTYITAVVPTGATTGPVVVTTPTGSLTSHVNFRILK
jgi:uncharacterized repeat protein (TIGR03803 family)